MRHVQRGGGCGAAAEAGSGLGTEVRYCVAFFATCFPRI